MESYTKPDILETYVLGGVRRYDINIDVAHDGEMYKWEQVSVPSEKWDYSGVVDALVSHKYPIDKMQAVINNYLLDPEDAYAIDEFNKMQAWRKKAKEIAKEALLYELH
jgi:hypothetical protein